MTGLHLLGVRHHGPGSARSVLAALDEIEPDIVLIEAPAEATQPFRWVGRGLVPPVALLGWQRDDPSRAVFAPFASFSPEWQAISWCNARQLPTEAIDLPLANTLVTPTGDEPASLFDDQPVDDAPTRRRLPIDPIGELAAAAGDPEPERWWEDVIEHRGEGLAAFAAVGEAMAAVRAGHITPLDEQCREAHMRKRIRAAVKSHSTVAVVCGAWHVPALDVSDRTQTPTASADNATLRGRPKVKVEISWVPWTHRRLARSSGYRAGVASPGWYAHMFCYQGPEAVSRFFVDAARELRAHDLPASPDDLIAATRMADTLSVMRGRPHAGLNEVLDAAEAVMGGLPLIRDRLVIGWAIGEVPDNAPQVPLAKDVAARQKSARLKPTADKQTVELDLRTKNGLRRSHLLHQITALGVPWGQVIDGRGSTGTFRETWELDWQPDFAVRIIEFAGYGTTLEAAATARLVERVAADGEVVAMANALQQALLADLGGAIKPLVAALATRAATDPDIVALMAALGPLAEAQRYGNVRAIDASAVRAVFDGLIVRILAGVVPATRSLDDDAAARMVERLSETQQALALIDHPARRQSFPAVLTELANSRGHGLLQGRATRLLHDAGEWNSQQVENRWGRALSGGTPAAVGAAFVEGFLAGSGTMLLHDSSLRAVVDRWLSSLRPETFTAVVPLLRRTFGGFEAAERRQLGQLFAGAGRDRPIVFGDDFDPARLMAVTTTVRHMLGLPVMAASESENPR